MLALSLQVFSAVLILVTLATMIPTGWKWIRIFDFPRLQTAVMMTAALVGLLAFTPVDNLASLVLIAALGLSLLVQLWHIYPYTALAPVQVRNASNAAPQACVRLMISNVRMESRESEQVLKVVRDADPDIAIFVETDDWWDTALAPLNDDYTFAVRNPQENFYGMIMYSRLPLLDHAVEHLTDENVPSIHAEIALQSGDKFALRVLHPVPPPLANTHRRDAEILIAGKKCLESELPNIVVGDLNDVGWSRITRLFVRTSGLVDPRVGRGLFASYHAEKHLFRWPLDHIFHDPAFSVRKIGLLPYVGSDHFPVFAELFYEPETKVPDAAPPPKHDDHARARDIIKDGEDRSPAPNEYPPQK